MVPRVRKSQGKLRGSGKVRENSEGQGKSGNVKVWGAKVNKDAQKSLQSDKRLL